MDKFSIPIDNSIQSDIALGSDHQAVKGKGVCEKVNLNIQGAEIMQDFLPFKLGSIDLILGMQWLITLGWTLSSIQKTSM